MEWGKGKFAQFKVPSNSNIFEQKQDQNIAVTDVTTSDKRTHMGDRANFCHACIKGGKKWGDTCWGLIPLSSKQRQCGCNSGGWSGQGTRLGACNLTFNAEERGGAGGSAVLVGCGRLCF